MKKSIWLFVSLTLVLTFTLNINAVHAATVTELVQDAKNSATVLKWAISVEGSADGKTRPWAQYNDAKYKKDKALRAIDTLPASQQDMYRKEIDNEVNIHIKRAMHYIDAITAGEKISAKKVLLSNQLEQGEMNDSVKENYFALTGEIRKQAILLDRVYGQTTREQIRSQYKYTAEAVVASALYPVSVWIDLNRMESAITIPGVSNKEVELRINNVNSWIPKVTQEEIKKKLISRYYAVSDLLNLPADELKTILTQTAIKYNIPPEVLKAIAWRENGIRQFNTEGNPAISADGGVGVMQITLRDETSDFDIDRLKFDTKYNIEVGAEILKQKWKYSGQRIPSVNNQEEDILENWYFAIMAYNGLSAVNDPTRNTDTYQSKVYETINSARIGADTGLFDETTLRIRYEDGFSIMYFDEDMHYTTPEKTSASQNRHIGEIVVLESYARYRSEPSTDGIPGSFPAGTHVQVIDGPYEDTNINNLFVWYQVKNSSDGTTGYMASSALQ